MNELQYYGNPERETGLTVYAYLYNELAVQVGYAILMSENNQTGIYFGHLPLTSEGSYVVRFFNGSKLLGQGSLEWDGEKEISSIDNEATTLKVNELHLIHGLSSEATMTVSTTRRQAGDIIQVISGDGETVSSVTRV